MNTYTEKFKVRLGLFITGGVTLFIIAIFIIGKQKNLFDPVFKLSTTFYNVSGLQVGSNIRFSGINVGTVNNIEIINDSTMKVDLLIKKNVQQFIKADCEASIGSAGIIGDRVLTISQGSTNAPVVKSGQHIMSKEPVEMDAIMASVKITTDNAAIISHQLAKIMANINSGHGTIGRLIQDTSIAANVSQTIVNLRKSSQGLDENMDAAKHNFLLKGYFKKKEKAAKKVKDDAEEKKVEEQKVSDNAVAKKVEEQKENNADAAKKVEEQKVKDTAIAKKTEEQKEKNDTIAKKADDRQTIDKKK